MKIILHLFYACILFVLTSCDGGLNPSSENGSNNAIGISGKITFIGEWPTDIKQTYIVLFKDPLVTALDFNPINLKYVSPLIPNGTSEFNFTSDESLFGEIEPGDYAYLAVAQTTAETLNLTRSVWRVAGVYNEGSGSEEGFISVPSNRFLTNIDIVCDFNNPPNQPPGG